MVPYNQFVCGRDGDALEVSNSTSGNTHPADWFFDWATNRSDAGISVTGYTALTHVPLWQGVNIIAGDIAQVPIRLLRNEFDEQKSHPSWNLLRVRPNELQTPPVWLETMIQWALVWGNGVSWIVRPGPRASRPTDLIPLRPDCLWPALVDFGQNQIMLYRYSSPTTGMTRTFFPWEVIHIQGLTSDGVWGYPLHEIAKNTIGYGLALEKHGSRNFSNGAQPSGVLEHPGKLTDDARGNLRREWDLIHRGADNSGKIAILWEGMKFQATSMTNIDAQWLDAKKLNRVDCASLLNLPAHKLNALEDSSVRSNLEEQNEVYKQMTLTRWSNRLNHEFKRKLLTENEWKSDEYEFHFDFDAYLKPDIDTLTQVGDRLVKAEIMNRNEARRMIGLAPYEGGDRFGSPAINPQPAENTSKNDENEPEGDDLAVQNAIKDALLAALTNVIEMEHHQLKRAAVGAKNFVAWLDGFYQHNGAPSELLTRFHSITGKIHHAALKSGLSVHDLSGIVASWGLKRHRTIVEMCSHVTAEQLPSSIEPFIAGRPEELAAQLLQSALENTDGN